MRKKRIELSKKLFLNKATLASLNQENLRSVKGGGYYPDQVVIQPPSRAQGYDCCIIATYGGSVCITRLDDCIIDLG